MKKRCLSLILALVIVLGLLPMGALASGSGGGGFPFLTQRDPGAPRRPALKREGNLVYRRGAQPFEPLSEKSASLALAAMCAR